MATWPVPIPLFNIFHVDKQSQYLCEQPLLITVVVVCVHVIDLLLLCTSDGKFNVYLSEQLFKPNDKTRRIVATDVEDFAVSNQYMFYTKTVWWRLSFFYSFSFSQ